MLPTEHLPGTATPRGPAPLARARGSRAHEAVAFYGAPAGGGSPRQHKPAGWGDGASCQSGGCQWSAYEDGTPHWPRPTSWGDGEACPSGGRCL